MYKIVKDSTEYSSTQFYIYTQYPFVFIHMSRLNPYSYYISSQNARKSGSSNNDMGLSNLVNKFKYECGH